MKRPLLLVALVAFVLFISSCQEVQIPQVPSELEPSTETSETEASPAISTPLITEDVSHILEALEGAGAVSTTGDVPPDAPLVSISGYVTLVEGDEAFLVDSENRGVVARRLFKSPWIESGKRVRVDGKAFIELSDNASAVVVVVEDPSSITVLGEGTPPIAKDITGREISILDVGALIRAEGTPVVDGSLLLDSSGVLLKLEGIADLSTSCYYEIQGVVVFNEGYSIFVESASAVSCESEESTEAGNLEKTTPIASVLQMINDNGWTSPESASTVTIEGVVTYSYTYYAYIVATDNSAGIKIYEDLYEFKLSLEPGQLVRITGKPYRKDFEGASEYRIQMHSASDLVVVGEEEIPTPITLHSGSALDLSLFGRVVVFSGEYEGKDEYGNFLFDNSGATVVIVSFSKEYLEDLEEGEEYEITGVVGQNYGYKLFLWSEDLVRPVEKELTLPEGAEKIEVAEIVDGDTFKDTGGTSYRVIGIDTPEIHESDKPIGEYGEEAKEFFEEYVSSHEIYFLKKGEDTYGRTLAYVFGVSDGEVTLYEEQVTLRGLARPLIYEENAVDEYIERIVDAYENAWRDEVGIFSKWDSAQILKEGDAWETFVGSIVWLKMDVLDVSEDDHSYIINGGWAKVEIRKDGFDYTFKDFNPFDLMGKKVKVYGELWEEGGNPKILLRAPFEVVELGEAEVGALPISHVIQLIDSGEYYSTSDYPPDNAPVVEIRGIVTYYDSEHPYYAYVVDGNGDGIKLYERSYDFDFELESEHEIVVIGKAYARIYGDDKEYRIYVESAGDYTLGDATSLPTPYEVPEGSPLTVELYGKYVEIEGVYLGKDEYGNYVFDNHGATFKLDAYSLNVPEDILKTPHVYRIRGVVGQHFGYRVFTWKKDQIQEISKVPDYEVIIDFDDFEEIWSLVDENRWYRWKLYEDPKVPIQVRIRGVVAFVDDYDSFYIVDDHGNALRIVTDGTFYFTAYYGDVYEVIGKPFALDWVDAKEYAVFATRDPKIVAERDVPRYVEVPYGEGDLKDYRNKFVKITARYTGKNAFGEYELSNGPMSFSIYYKSPLPDDVKFDDLMRKYTVKGILSYRGIDRILIGRKWDLKYGESEEEYEEEYKSSGLDELHKYVEDNDIRDYEDAREYIVEGTVAYKYVDYAYLVADDNTGIKIYTKAIDLRSFNVGDRVVVVGRPYKYYQGGYVEYDLRLEYPSLIKKIGTSDLPDPTPVSPCSLSKDLFGKYVVIEGKYYGRGNHDHYMFGDCNVENVFKRSNMPSGRDLVMGYVYKVKGVIGQFYGYKLFVSNEDWVEFSREDFMDIQYVKDYIREKDMREEYDEEYRTYAAIKGVNVYSYNYYTFVVDEKGIGIKVIEEDVPGDLFADLEFLEKIKAVGEIYREEENGNYRYVLEVHNAEDVTKTGELGDLPNTIEVKNPEDISESNFGNFLSVKAVYENYDGYDYHFSLEDGEILLKGKWSKVPYIENGLEYSIMAVEMLYYYDGEYRILTSKEFLIANARISDVINLIDEKWDSEDNSGDLTIEGVVAHTYNGKIFVVDEYGDGIMIYSPKCTLKYGMKVRLYGDAYKNDSDYVISSPECLILSESADLPEPIPIESGQELDESWYGKYVVLEATYVGRGDDDEYTFDNGEEKIVEVEGNFSPELDLTEGMKYRVIGVVGYYYGYKIFVERTEDVQQIE